MRIVLIVFAVCVFAVLPSRADQCQLVSKDVVLRAYDILNTASSYVDFCAPCMDSEPVTRPIDTVAIKKEYYAPDNEILYTILINGMPVDLAYVYVNGKNLGVQASCIPIERVPEYIES